MLPPADLKAAIENSHVSHAFSDSVQGPPKITTAAELQKFIADLEKIADLYRRHLPPEVFNSPVYKTNVEAINKQRRPSLKAVRGYEYLNIGEDREVYVVRRDIFTVYVIEEKGELRVLALGVGE